MHSYFANLYDIECASQCNHRTLENISIWDITEHFLDTCKFSYSIWDSGVEIFPHYDRVRKNPASSLTA